MPKIISVSDINIAFKSPLTSDTMTFNIYEFFPGVGYALDAVSNATAALCDSLSKDSDGNITYVTTADGRWGHAETATDSFDYVLKHADSHDEIQGKVNIRIVFEEAGLYLADAEVDLPDTVPAAIMIDINALNSGADPFALTGAKISSTQTVREVRVEPGETNKLRIVLNPQADWSGDVTVFGAVTYYGIKSGGSTTHQGKLILKVPS